MGECYFCGENKGKWCKLCQKSFCPDDHQEEIKGIQAYTEHLDWHTYYGMEFLGVKF